jgi:hypothetical protein
LAEGKLRRSSKYVEGFKPKLWEPAFSKSTGKNKFVFVCDMGDLFGEWVPSKWIQKTLTKIKEFDHTNTFMLLTKNPKRYAEFLDLYPDNVILGATIETNRDYQVSKAPKPQDRYSSFRSLCYSRKTVSVEPIMDFDPVVLCSWLREINPEFVHLGYDNYCHKLPEPEIQKTLALKSQLEKFMDVRTKSIRVAWWQRTSLAIKPAR